MRYPLAPLTTALGIELGQPGRPGDAATHGIPALAEALNCSAPTAERLHRDGLTNRHTQGDPPPMDPSEIPPAVDPSGVAS